MVDTFEQASSWNPREWNVTPNSDLELCQCELRWLSNEWCEYRRELDDWVVRMLLQREVRSVKRLVLYDLASNARIEPGNQDGLYPLSHRELTLRHTEWISGLKNDLAVTVGRHNSGRRLRKESIYEIKLLILGRATEIPDMPRHDWFSLKSSNNLHNSRWWTTERSIWANAPLPRFDSMSDELVPIRLRF